MDIKTFWNEKKKVIIALIVAAILAVGGIQITKEQEEKLVDTIDSVAPTFSTSPAPEPTVEIPVE